MISIIICFINRLKFQKSLILFSICIIVLNTSSQAIAQHSVPSPASLLPPLVPVSVFIAISKNEVAQLSAYLNTNPSDSIAKLRLDAYNFILANATQANPDLPLILANAYPLIDPNPSLKSNQVSGFYTNNWTKEFASIVNILKK